MVESNSERIAYHAELAVPTISFKQQLQISAIINGHIPFATSCVCIPRACLVCNGRIAEFDCVIYQQTGQAKRPSESNSICQLEKTSNASRMTFECRFRFLELDIQRQFNRIRNLTW